ncbi:unnamed protein product, partial [marine sediment metagenome]
MRSRERFRTHDTSPETDDGSGRRLRRVNAIVAEVAHRLAAGDSVDVA